MGKMPLLGNEVKKLDWNQVIIFCKGDKWHNLHKDQNGNNFHFPY